ncbi:uncharacterized protein AB675_5055 [Cyphellophora attinorum]|uniref:RING-type domain-containing protein n=1 Tax=Cyphellophora attinorum TaxID=1664694 RepID=A0A0N1NZY5_9EURO|nr:uncharacterized protein AB675_5055 [Phialophora attinorum]KPI39507.1 hypothetical protein AB675_5055 [Phialophora attinorum]
MAATPAAAAKTTGLLNLEKELICFICTEVLYQPLTLLDCLHTFCGSCLKEWFSHQHRKATHSHSPVRNPLPYTCPTCRADVKDAQHNAMITTLLDMFLTANPDRARSEEEKAEMAKIYKPPENILPRVDGRRSDRRRREQEDPSRRERHSTDIPRQRSSTRDTTASPYQPRRDNLLTPDHAHTTSRSRSREHDRARERRIQERTERRERRHTPAEEDVLDQSREDAPALASPPQSPPISSPRHPDAVEARQRGARTVAHQASLRSMVSASDSGTGTGDSLDEARLMQEILAEGLLDGIDIDTLTEEQQDELSEVIAQRYRELHPRPSQRSAQTSAPTSPEPTTDIATAMQNLRVKMAAQGHPLAAQALPEKLVHLRHIPLRPRLADRPLHRSRKEPINADHRITGLDHMSVDIDPLILV